MNVYFILQILFSGLVSGLILFQSAFVAPTVFKNVPEELRGPFLRKIFPKLFKAEAVCGAVIFFCTFLEGPEIPLGYAVGGVTFLAGIGCNAIIPATNRAKDNGDEKKFAMLHKISVLVTVGALLLNMTWFLFLP